MLKSERIDGLFRAAMEELALEDLEYCKSIPKTPLLVGDEVRRRIFRASKISKVKIACITGLNVLKKVAIACLIVVSFAFTCAMCIEPVREAIIEAVVTWYEDHIGFRFESEGASCDMNAKPIPTDLPEGWRIEVQKENAAANTYNIFGLDSEYVFYQHVLEIKEELWIDYSDTVVEVFLEDGTKAYLAYNEENDMFNLLWFKGTSGFQLTSQNVLYEDLIKIANSIK